MGKLTALGVKNAKSGRHADGGGLYMLVKESGARSWLLRVQVGGKRRDIGLGTVDTETRKPGDNVIDQTIPILHRRQLTLSEARQKADILLRAAKAGLDPAVERDRDRSAAPTFKAATIACHAEMSRGWVFKHAAAFLASLERHAYPALGSVRVDQVDAAAIRDALAPIWIDTPVAARKIRQRIGMVLNYSKSKGWRTDEAPGKSVTIGLARHVRGGNFTALHYSKVPDLMTTIRSGSETVGRMALMFTILTAARSGEVRSVMWSHVDLDAKLWTRPAALMKSRLEHAVTLSDEAVSILKRAAEMRTTKADCLIFPGKGGKMLSDMTMTAVLRDAKVTVTVHGFRSSFRDWAAELMPTIPGEVAEAALAHAVKDATERAYRRTDFLDMRRKLIDAWGSYTAGRDNVLRLAAG
jgi:integrase